MADLASRPKSAKRTTVGWQVAGRSGGAAPFLRVALAIVPTLCQQHSASEEDLQEQGQHVHSHALGGARLSFLERSRPSFFIKIPEKGAVGGRLTPMRRW